MRRGRTDLPRVLYLPLKERPRRRRLKRFGLRILVSSEPVVKTALRVLNATAVET